LILKFHLLIKKHVTKLRHVQPALKNTALGLYANVGARSKAVYWCLFLIGYFVHWWNMSLPFGTTS